MPHDHAAAPLLALLQFMKGRDVSKMTRPDLKAFRKEAVERFGDAATRLYSHILAGIPDEQFRSHMPFPYPGDSKPANEPVVAEAVLIPSYRFMEFKAASTKPTGVHDLLELEPATLCLGLHAQNEIEPEPVIYLALSCDDEPAQQRIEEAVKQSAADLQAACERASSFMVFSRGDAEVATANPPDLRAAMKQCVAQVLAKVGGRQFIYPEPFGLEVVIKSDTPPEAVAAAVRALILLYRAVTSPVPHRGVAATRPGSAPHPLP
ncbi:MAG: hypothetical protein OEL20_05330 [Sulfuritalea sp.]|nr:hypothetical protein [Sulfuritalea sp.]